MSTQGLSVSGASAIAAPAIAAGCKDDSRGAPGCGTTSGTCRRAGFILPVLLAGASVLAAGCAGLPSAPGMVNTPPRDGLSPTVPAGSPSGVIPTSATEPVASPPGSAAVPKSDDDSGFEWSDLSPTKVVENVKKATGYGPDEQLAQSLFGEGKALYEQKEYPAAAEKFKAAAKRWPDSVLEEDALFWLGECYFFADQYPKAQDTFGNLLKKYDNSRHLDTVVKRLFAIGHYWEQLHQAHPHWPVTPNLTDKERPWFDTFGNALNAYETVRMKDPTGPLAEYSIMATANAHFGRGHYEDAAYYYDLLREEYPRSEHQLQAHVLGLQSKLRVYQGKLYDGTPLDEADEIAQQAVIQFRGQLGEEQVRVAAARDRILEQKAERDWGVAQYYDNKKQFGHARVYYQYIIRDYPLTQTAHKARARLDQIRDDPDQPINRFKWLTDLFPADD